MTAKRVVLDEDDYTVTIRSSNPPTWGDIEKKLVKTMKTLGVGDSSRLLRVAADVSVGGKDIHIIRIAVEKYPE